MVAPNSEFGMRTPKPQRPRRRVERAPSRRTTEFNDETSWRSPSRKIRRKENLIPPTAGADSEEQSKRTEYKRVEDESTVIKTEMLDASDVEALFTGVTIVSDTRYKEWADAAEKMSNAELPEVVRKESQRELLQQMSTYQQILERVELFPDQILEVMQVTGDNGMRKIYMEATELDLPERVRAANLAYAEWLRRAIGLLQNMYKRAERKGIPRTTEFSIDSRGRVEKHSPLDIYGLVSYNTSREWKKQIEQARAHNDQRTLDDFRDRLQQYRLIAQHLERHPNSPLPQTKLDGVADFYGVTSDHGLREKYAVYYHEGVPSKVAEINSVYRKWLDDAITTLERALRGI